MAREQGERDARHWDAGRMGPVERTWRGMRDWLKSEGEDWESEIAEIAEAAEVRAGDDGYVDRFFFGMAHY